MATDDVPCCDQPMFWVYLVICVALVCFAGLMSGLTLGLMSLSLVDLEILIKAGQPQDQKNAAKILPIVKNQHLLLCTLLICHALAIEALPIFLDGLMPAWASILISVTLVIAISEIIPHAICSHYGLKVGAKLSGLVRVIVIIAFPIAYPISKLLDFVLGEKHTPLMRRAELKTLVDIHANSVGKGGELTKAETTIIAGALEMTEKTVKDAMTPISKVFSLDFNSKLDRKTIELIMSKGHSRVPIYSGRPQNIVGLILVKNLINCRAEDETPIRDLVVRSIPRVHDDLPLYDILNQFQKGHSHMAVVTKRKKETAEGGNHPKSFAADIIIKQQYRTERNGISYQVGRKKQQHDLKKLEGQNQTKSNKLDLESCSDSDEVALGIITMEDVMEELLQEEIWDEHDKISTNGQAIIKGSPFRSPFRSPASRYLRLNSGASMVSSHEGSPLSSRGLTPVLRSPLSPYVQPPYPRPVLSASPSRFIPKSPAGYPSGARYSPSTLQVTIKSSDKLRKTPES